jgi:tetratricopeptide (TPR) repeat protein
MLSRTFGAACSVLVLIASVGCSTSPTAKEAKYLKRGQAQMAKKDYSRAILEFRSACGAMPGDAEPYYQLGLASLQAGQAAEAVVAFRKAKELNPKHSGAQLKLAELMAASRNKGLVEQAASLLMGVIAASPDNAEAIEALARTDVRLGKSEDAEKLLEESLQRFPGYLESSVTLARLKLRQNDMAGAETVLKAATASAPQSVPAVLALGQFYLFLKQPEKAEPQMRKALQLDPKNPDALAAVGEMQLKGGRGEQAERTFQQLAALPDARYKPMHAIFLYRTGKTGEAITELQKIVKGDPENRDARTTLLSLFLRLNRTQDAQDLLSAAVKRNSRDTDALFQRSALYLKSGKLKEADQDLRQVLKFKPDSSEAHYVMASVFKAEGLQHLENGELRVALRLQPNLLGARLSLVRSFLVAGQPKSALELLDQTPPSQRATLPVITDRIWALLAMGDTQQAKAMLQPALQIRRVPQLVLQEAVVKMQERDFAGARIAADEALRGDPGDVRAARILVGAYVGLDQQSKALERLKEIVAYRPKSAPLQQLLAEWYVDAGNLVEARKALEAALTADQAFLPAELALAELDRKENQMDAARTRLTAIVKANPNNVSALLLLADVEQATGDQEGAISRYRSVLAVDSSNLFALNNLAYQLAAENPDEALKFAQQAAEAAPDNAAVLDTLARVLYRKGVYNTAEAYLKTAISKEPTPRRQFHLGMSYLKSGQRDLGRQLMLTALQQDPNLAKTEQGW